MASEKLAAGLVNSGYSVGWVGACTVGVTSCYSNHFRYQYDY